MIRLSGLFIFAVLWMIYFHRVECLGYAIGSVLKIGGCQ